MLKELLKEGGLYTLATLLTKGVSLMLIPFYTSYFSTEDYGLLEYLAVFGGFINGFFSLQIYQGLARYVADNSTSIEDKKAFASTGLYATIAMFSLFSLIIFFNRPFYTEKLIGGNNQHLLILFTIQLCLSNVFHYLNTYIKYDRNVKLFALISFVYSLLNIIIIIFLVAGLSFGIESIFYASMVTSALFIIFQIIVLRKKLTLKFSKNHLKTLLKFSLPLVPAVLSFTIMVFTDRWFIKEYLNLSELGIYGVGYKFSSVVVIIATAFSMALSPIIYNRYKDENVQKDISRIFNLFIGVGMFFIFLISIFSKETIEIFTDSKFHDAQYLMPIFYFTVGISLLTMFSLGLQIQKKTKTIAIIALIGAVLNLVLNIVLVPKNGVYGAATATFIAVGTHSITTFYLSQKEFPYKNKIKYFFLIIIVNALIIYLFSYKFELHWIYKIGISLVYCLILSFVYKNELDNLWLKVRRKK